VSSKELDRAAGAPIGRAPASPGPSPTAPPAEATMLA